MEPAAMQRRRRHSQVVRQGTANPRFSGSNPDGASIKGPEQKLRAFSFWPPLPYPAAPMVRGRTDVVLHPRPGGRGSPPYGALGMCQRANGVVQCPAEGASRTPPPTGGCETKVAAYDVMVRFLPASQMVRGLCPRNINRWSVNTRLTHRGKHEQNRSGQTATANPTPRSRNHGAPRTVHPTGDS